MDWVRSFLFFVSSIALVVSTCPHKETGLLDWDDKSAWKDGKVPEDDDDAILTGSVLVNSQPPKLHHLTISSGAKLVFDPDTVVHLKVHAIYIEGEFVIGSNSCLFDGNVTVTFLGEVMEDKVLLVKSGGTLEIHGERRLPWTKLAQTAPRLQEVPDILEGKDNLDFCNDKCDKGLIVYVIDPENGQLIYAHRFELVVQEDELEIRIAQFLTTLGDIPDGQIVGIGIKKQIVSEKDNHDLTKIYEGIEALAHIGKQTPLRNADQGSAYAMLTIKGDSSSTIESFEANTGKHHSVFAKMYYKGLAYVMESYVLNKAMSCNSKLYLHVYDDTLYRPTITLLDDVSTWKQGDKLVMASTDFDSDQAEEVTVLSIPSANQIQLSAPLKFTHYGQIYKGVDMRGEVGLLSRNVKFTSEDASTSEFYGGHIKVLNGFDSVHIEGGEFENLGQQEILGSYSIHFHMCGNVDDDLDKRPWIRQNSIHHTNTRCVTIHNTMGVLIEENVCYKTIGHSYFLEDGSEQRNIFDGNLGLGTEDPPKGRGLIPTDRTCPTTFWVTNPKNYLRNNVAAGSHCRGYWYNYPDEPLIDDAHKNDPSGKPWMKKLEARFTRVYEFENNVAHSGGSTGLQLDNILKPNGESSGYNKYRPMKNPVENNCIEDYSKCEQDCVYLNRFTGYKNRGFNAWIRGGCIYLTNSSMSDGLTGLAMLKDNTHTQFFERSIVIGDSDNYGVPESFLPKDGPLQRSFPGGMNMVMRTRIRNGVEYRTGPTFYKDIWFADFKDTNDYYKMGAIGFPQGRNDAFSSRNTITNAKFGFVDPTEGNRVNDYSPEDEQFTNLDGDDNHLVRDDGETVSQASCNDQSVTATIVRPEAFHVTSNCKSRDNWNMAWCCNNYATIRVIDNSKIDNEEIVTMVRDDDVDAALDSDMDRQAPFLVATGGEFSYTMYFNSDIPKEIHFQTWAITKSNYVRLGVCLPPNAEFELKRFNPHVFGISKWTKVSTLADLDKDTTGKKYFYHADSGYFATIIIHEEDFLPGELYENPEGNRASRLLITIKKGDRKKTTCLDSVRKSLGDMTPKKVSRKRSLQSLIRRLMEKNSSYISKTDSRILQADSVNPPSDWGAHSTHVPWPRQNA